MLATVEHIYRRCRSDVIRKLLIECLMARLVYMKWYDVRSHGSEHRTGLMPMKRSKHCQFILSGWGGRTSRNLRPWPPKPTTGLHGAAATAEHAYCCRVHRCSTRLIVADCRAHLRWCPIAPVDSAMALTTDTRESSISATYPLSISPTPCWYVKLAMEF